MPRYCAVKVCKSRGGTASKDNKRISFYPFPLQDQARLQRWVDNMRRDEWAPSRHQYLCSAHFTEDCFDVRWGIRYLKNTAVPTIFPSSQGDGEERSPGRKTSKPRTRSCNSEIQPVRPDPLPSKKPIILRRRTIPADLSNDNPSTPNTVVNQSAVPATSERRLSSSLSRVAFDEVLPSETQTEVFGCSSQLPGEFEGALPLSCSVLSVAVETQQADSTTAEVTVLRCESLGPVSERQTLPATLEGQMFRIVPVELKGEGQPDDPSFREWVVPDEAEPMCAYEHSYSRQDTDREQLWSRIMSLHAKIVELDRREETTVAKIHSLESEIAHLKRDSVVFDEKQRVLEDYISSVLL
ncbi:THAP domain-containing protein 5-like [Osmerus mordax]|uniref:THAP domain-containing protein 5-like n=1 Tax=Osmerus mordax TaxID=8014 RepID=UPI0035107FC8